MSFLFRSSLFRFCFLNRSSSENSGNSESSGSSESSESSENSWSSESSENSGSYLPLFNSSSLRQFIRLKSLIFPFVMRISSKKDCIFFPFIL